MRSHPAHSTPIRAAAAAAVLALALLGLLVRAPGAVAHSPHDDITDIVVSPAFARDQTVFIISRGRLQRSTDGGGHWQDIVRGLGRAPLARLAISPTDPRRLLATSNSEGLFRSVDGGDSWSRIGADIGDPLLREVAWSPERPDVALVAGGLFGLHRTDDGGDSWTSIPDFGRVTAMAFLHDGSGTAVVGDADGHISVSTDDGLTWRSARPLPGSGEVAALATSPDAPATVVAVLADGQVTRSDDGGASFAPVGEPLPGGTPRGLALDPDGEQWWVSTADAGPYRSDDAGETWVPQADGLTKSDQADDVGVPHFRAIRVASAGDGSTLFLASFDGLFRSDRDADRWQPIETASDYIAGLAVSPAYAADRTVVVTTYVKGAFISEDGGDSWRPMNGGLGFDGLSEGNRVLPLRRGHNVVLSPDFARDRTIFSATWPQLIRSLDGGETWEAIDIEQPTEDWSPLRQYVLAVSPTYAADRTVFAGNRDGQVLRSQAGGDPGSWAEVGRVEGRVRSFAVSPAFADDQVIFVGSVGGVFKSTDGGASWQPTGPGRSPLAEGGELDPAPLLAMSPTFPTDGTLFAGTESGLFVTRDGGATWEEVDAEGVTPDADVTAVGVSPDFAADRTVLVSVRGVGLHRSSDGGASFSPVAPALAESNRVIADYDNPTSSPIQFSRTFASDRTVFAYAGPDVLRSTDGGSTWDVLPLPTVADVAEILGVEVDALSDQSLAQAGTDEAGRSDDDGTDLTLPELAIAAAAALAAGLAVRALHLGQRRSPGIRRAIAVGGPLLIFVTVAVAMAV
ncbi:MAG: WD40/YVTN/BNR-like repeat-containing protein [Acidimicrobiia bacterium]